MGDLFTEDADFFFQNFAGLFSALRGLVGSSKVLGLGFRMSIELTDLPVTVGEGLFELLDGAAMSGFAIAELDFQLVDVLLGRFKLLLLGAAPIPFGQALVELGNMVSEDPDLFL